MLRSVPQLLDSNLFIYSVDKGGLAAFVNLGSKELY